MVSEPADLVVYLAIDILKEEKVTIVIEARILWLSSLSVVQASVAGKTLEDEDYVSLPGWLGQVAGSGYSEPD